MNNREFLYKELGLGCWHDFDKFSGGLCGKCESLSKENTDLTTWPGFGLAFPAMQKHPRWEEFLDSLPVLSWADIPVELINPQRFYEALCEFFGLEARKQASSDVSTNSSREGKKTGCVEASEGEKECCHELPVGEHCRSCDDDERGDNEYTTRREE